MWMVESVPTTKHLHHYFNWRLSVWIEIEKNLEVERSCTNELACDE